MASFASTRAVMSACAEARREVSSLGVVPVGRLCSSRVGTCRFLFFCFLSIYCKANVKYVTSFGSALSSLYSLGAVSLVD